MQRFFSIFYALVLLTFLVGCGSGHVSLKGKVTFSDNDEPLTQGTVAFVKDGRLSRGEIQSDGTYTVGTEKVSDGLPPGNYQVYISGTSKAIPVGEHGSFNYEPQIDPKYEYPETSGLTVTVDASTKEYNIQVDRVASGRR